MYKVMLFIFLIVSCASHQISTKVSTELKTIKSVTSSVILTADEKKKLLTPTIYYIPRHTDFENNDCLEIEKTNLITIKNEIIAKSCRKVYKACEMEGTCIVESNGKSVLINIDERNSEGVRTFQVIQDKYCIYGLGAARDRVKGYRHMCIDPFYSVAADLSIYNLGDVLFVPLLKGLILPDGHKHNGYFIVRDSGGLIKGEGRFDFFTGYFGINRKNPFYKLGLAGDNIFPDYKLIKGKEADHIRKLRLFPYLKLPLKKTAQVSN